MKKGDRVFGLICLGLSFWLIFEASYYDYMTEFTPGPGFHPFWLGVCLGLLSLYLIIDTFKREGSKEDEKKHLPGRKSLLRIGLILFIMAGFAFSMMRLGFVVTVFVFVALILFALEGYSILKSVVYGVMFSGFIFLIFSYWLEVDLPKGLLGL
ncbi:MAG: tripartite tricarboxylate transporter TctB family protein [Deltaproteobacteria bacterium]|nr:tripartite tricarboxylate transporter TctB family protein [Deltaproteobacteria bacterium]MBW2306491.1 tripartite tricarboxylate transporter TctB family protein [Deltaproteobacteria bacterium]